MVRAWLEGRFVQTGGQFWRRTFLERASAPGNPAIAKQHDVEIALKRLCVG